MPDEIKINRPQPQPVSRPEHVASAEPASSGSSKTPWIILVVVVVLLVIFGVLFRDRLFGAKGNKAPAASENAQSSGYQAVFLTNGQVYFGKLTGADADYPMLADIYYLQVGPQQGSGTQTEQQQQQQISLVKLGNELHGPVDEMHISRTQILFYEDMKADSQVVKAIQSYKANPSGAAPTPAPAK